MLFVELALLVSESATSAAEMPTPLFTEWVRNEFGITEITEMEELERMPLPEIGLYQLIYNLKIQALVIIVSIGSRTVS